MGESRNEAKDRDKQNNIQGASQDTTQRLRLDSYVNIDEDEIHIESEAAEEVKKPSDEPYALRLWGTQKRGVNHSLIFFHVGCVVMIWVEGIKQSQSSAWVVCIGAI